jgi:hypothetical protein
MEDSAALRTTHYATHRDPVRMLRCNVSSLTAAVS